MPLERTSRTARPVASGSILAQLLFERLARLLERLTAGWCDANRGQRPVSRLPELLSGVERDEGFRRRMVLLPMLRQQDGSDASRLERVDPNRRASASRCPGYTGALRSPAATGTTAATRNEDSRVTSRPGSSHR